jgi:hypothetical protein
MSAKCPLILRDLGAKPSGAAKGIESQKQTTRMREKIDALQTNIHAACRAGVLMMLVFKMN